MYLAKLYAEAHFATEKDAATTICEQEINDDYLVKDLGFHNAVYYIEKFEQGDEMEVCGTCAEYVRENHGLSDEEYEDLAQSARSH